MKSKRRKGMKKARFPPEIWANIMEFLDSTRTFYSLYFLNKELHSYPWKSSLNQLEFKMKQDIEFFAHYDFSYDFSYVSSLNLRGLRGFDDSEIQYLKGIHTLDLSDCAQITDKGLVHLKGIHTLSLCAFKQITDKGLVHLKGIHFLNLMYCRQITDKGLEHVKGVQYIY
jgi:hypothetical protein